MTPLRLLMPAAAILLLVAAAPAQDNLPRVGYVYPAGGKQGGSVDVTLGGRSFVGATAVRLTGAGVSAAITEVVKIPTGKELNDLRETVRVLQERLRASRGQAPRPASRPASGPASQPAPASASRPVWTPEDAKRLEDIRALLALAQKRRQNPALAETVYVRITIDPNAPTGRRELRLLTPNGLSNPVAFHVGSLPEYRETESELVSSRTEGGLTLPVVINGQCAPGDIDRFRFHASKGQRLLVSAAVRALIPYISDAVPGWFQPVISLHDSAGRELAYADHYRFHPDPVLFVDIPADGDYVVEIHDSIYRGREDFVYRLTVGELPFLTDIFPLGGRTGAATTVQLAGWNLPQQTLSMTLLGAGVFPICVGLGPLASNARASNSLPFAADTLPELLEAEPNDRLSVAQSVTLPVIVNGRIGKPGDKDLYRFDGRAGQKIVAEILARRLESPLDSILTLTDAGGAPLASNDDHEDKASALNTHHADSYLAFTLPADGAYCIQVADTQSKGGPEYAYRLRLDEPRPDFALRLCPSGLTVRRGASAPFTVYALRRDGFAGEIALALKDPPAGFRLSAAKIPAGQDSVRLTLAAPPAAPDRTFRLDLEGRAVIAGRPVSHAAVPADDMEQAFSYRHLVPASEFLVQPVGRPRAPGAAALAGAKILSPTPLLIPAGAAARLRVGIGPNPPKGVIHLELAAPPDGLSIRSVSHEAGSSEILLQSDAAKIKPGLEGTLIINVFLQRTPSSATSRPAAAGQRTLLGALPAVPFRVVAR